jgi:hypothetical protein
LLSEFSTHAVDGSANDKGAEQDAAERERANVHLASVAPGARIQSRAIA